MVSGTPMWLFRLPLVACTLNFFDKTEAVSSFTVVFPLLPVRPSTGMSAKVSLWYFARSCKVLRTSSTTIILSESPIWGSSTTAAIHPDFKAFRANSKAAKHNGGVNPPGDKAIVKSTTAPAANQKTEAVDVVAEVKQGKSIKGKIGDPIKAAYHGEEKKKAKKDDKLDDGDGMDPVGKADADIDNDGDVDKTDNYLNNRRKAISSKMKSKREDAVMHGGKGGAKSEKKEKETMAVGEGAMKRMSTGDGMDTFKKKPKDEAFSSSAIVKKDRRGDGKPMGDPRQMKDPKKDSMVSKDGKVKVIDKDKEKDHLKKGFVRAEDYSAPKMNQVTPNTSNAMSKYKTEPTVPKTPKRPAKPQMGLLKPTMKKGSAY
mgnify:CR=1 FL=1